MYWYFQATGLPGSVADLARRLVDNVHACYDDAGAYETKVIEIDQMGHEVLDYALLDKDLSRVLGKLHAGGWDLLIGYQPVLCACMKDVQRGRAME